MTNVRSYKDALEPQAAVAECRRCSGTQFWPDAVDALERAHHAERAAATDEAAATAGPQA
jgi:HD-GYP domain-containing protein (c-di-GMP phosphodiesterase class II)